MELILLWCLQYACVLCLVFSLYHCIYARMLFMMWITMSPIRCIKCSLLQFKVRNGWWALDVTRLWVTTFLLIPKKPSWHHEKQHLWLKLQFWEGRKWKTFLILMLNNIPLTLLLCLCSLTYLVRHPKRTCHPWCKIKERDLTIICLFLWKLCFFSTDIRTFHFDWVNTVNCWLSTHDVNN